MINNNRRNTSFIWVALTAFLLVGCNTTQNSSSSSEVSSISETVDVAQYATVRGKILLDNGEMVTAGIVVVDEVGNSYRALTNILSAYNLRLPAGSYTLYFTRGIEYSIVSKTITVEEYKTYYLQDVRLIHLEDTFAKGWVGGDLHQHTFYSDGMNSVDDVLLSNITNGLYYGFLSDHNSARGLAEWTQGNRTTAYIDNEGNQRMFSAFDAVEVTTEYGHYQSLGIGLTFDMYEVILRDIERVLPQAQKDALIKERIQYIADTIKRSGGVAQINHPYSTSTMGFNYWEIADSFDTLEIWNGVYAPGDGRYEPESESMQSQNYRCKTKWFDLLNEVKNGGKYLAATGGTDNHDVSGAYTFNPDFTEVVDKNDYFEWYQQKGRYSGVPTTYTHIDGEVTQEKVLSALREGHSFITNGPIMYANIDGATYGETASLSGTTATIALTGFARDGWEGVRVIKNGVALQTIENLDTSSIDINIELNGLVDGDWIVLEGLGNGVQYAITNPIFISIPV